MQSINKITVFDKCVDGDINKLSNLLDEGYLNFNEMYKVCKELFSEQSDSIDKITFSQLNFMDSVFEVTCSSEIDVSSVKDIVDKETRIKVNRTENGYVFNIHSNKEV